MAGEWVKREYGLSSFHGHPVAIEKGNINNAWAEILKIILFNEFIFISNTNRKI